MLFVCTALLAQAQGKGRAMREAATGTQAAARGAQAAVQRQLERTVTSPLEGRAHDALQNAARQTLYKNTQAQEIAPSPQRNAPTGNHPSGRTRNRPPLQNGLKAEEFAQPRITPARAQEEQKALRLLKENRLATQEQQELEFRTGIGKSVLFAPVEGPEKTGGFSVTAVRTNVNGQEEIFGVIASHVLPESYYTFNASLKRVFHVQVKQLDGTVRLLEAEVVQISPRSMLDISLVKFSPQAQALVRPLSLSDEPARINEPLFSYGHRAGIPDKEERIVQNNSFISTRTDQNLEGAREGFCGSPLLDIQGQVKAIHTGTRSAKNTEDISYGTHAHFINLLVEAYHNQGQASYDLVIDGQNIAQLNVDEYISALYLFDETGKRVAQTNLEDKFSQSLLLKMLEENPQAAYLQITSRKAHWETDKDGDSILKEDRSRNDKTKRQHWYNLQTQQRESTRPDIIKM